MSEPKTGQASLGLDDAIRLRWVLRDIIGKRLKFSPIAPNDLQSLIDLGHIEMKDEVPTVTRAGLDEIAIGNFCPIEVGLKAKNKMTPRGPEIPNHHERRFMQHLEGSGWVKAFTMRSSPKVVEKLLTKGWIEKSLIEGRLCYLVTDQGLAAKKMRA